MVLISRSMAPADLDGRNMDQLLTLSESSDDRRGFADGFRDIVASVGATLEATRLANVSAEARKEAADQAVDDISGVSLDDEAARLMEQQQAYQAAARVLQVARDIFDTLIQIR